MKILIPLPKTWVIRIQYKVFVSFIVLWVAFAGAAKAQDTPKSPATLLQEATQRYETGDFDGWRKALDDALAAAKAAGLKKDQADAFNGLGDYFKELVQPIAAREQYDKALALWREIGDRKGEAATQLNIGMLEEDGGRQGTAREAYLAALKIFRALDDLKGEAEALRQVGSSYLVEEQAQKAAAYLQQAVSLYRDEKVTDKANEARALDLLGESFHLQEQFDKAIDLFEDAFKLQQELKNSVLMATAYQKQATSYFLKGDPNMAANRANFAARVWSSVEDRGHEMGALIEQAVYLSTNGQSDTALTKLRQALEILEGPRELYSYLRANEISYFRELAYPLIIKLLLEQKQPEEAFLWAQRAKVAPLREAMIAGGKEPTCEATKEELQQEQALRERVTMLRRRIMAQQSHKVIMTGAGNIVIESRTAENDLVSFTAALYKKHPRLQQARASTGLRLSALGDFLPDNVALLEFARSGYLWEHKLVLFCVTMRVGHPTLTTYQVNTQGNLEVRPPLQSLVEDFRLSCADARREPTFSGPELYAILLSEAAPAFAKKHRLLIAPDGPLWGLPFSALPDEKGEPLARNFSIAYTPCATLTKFATAKNAPFSLEPDTAASPTPKRSMALLGVAPTPSALLKNLFPDAAASNALNIASDARLLHIGAPFTMAAQSALRSGLARLAPSAPLSVADILGLTAPARIAVFAPSKVTKAAKETGIDGDQWSLLHHAFLNTGISAQLMTFDAVPDAQAAPFLKAFYKHLKEGRPAGTALRDATRDLLADPKTAHPAYWARFFLFGNWEQEM